MNNKVKAISISAIAIIALFFISTYVFKENKKKALSFMALDNVEIFVRDHSPILGEPDAKVYLVEFLDPECESCKAFYPSVKQLLKLYPGKIKLVVRYVPFHKNSRHAIKVLEASRKQNLFWQSLEEMFNQQSVWASHHDPRPEKVFPILEKIGVDINKLKEDMKSPAIDKVIETDFADSKTLQVRGTPSFFVNGKGLETFGFEQLKKLVEQEINKNY
ncbi:thioredoxin domain-containing protein [Halobacteriovorax sp. HLS]|uniref:DsbA family protein n=1 Tax=Halobacteriovorax sp. HLS TaxID=2234000 RepID=UPI001F4E49C2|nr:thioredoxin domain-containing protein [Halobacteriovorax sp. HLS]